MERGHLPDGSGSVSDRQRWLGVALLAGALYLVAGITSASLAGTAASPQLRFFWRLSAFVISGVVLAAHILFENLRHRSAAPLTAWRASVGAAIGGFALAVAANIHDVGTASGYRLRMAVALLVWPLLTAVPAFVVALAVAAGLGARRPRI